MSRATLTRADLAELVESGRADLADPEFRALARRLVLPAGRTASDIRYRSLASFRTEIGSTPGAVSGMASVYNVEYAIGYGRRERIAPGVFAGSLRRNGASLILTHEHNWDAGPIGVARAWEGSGGLHFDGRLFVDSDLGGRVYRAVASRAISGMSIGYVALTVEFDGEHVDVVTEGELLELAVVLRGANAAAFVAAN